MSAPPAGAVVLADGAATAAAGAALAPLLGPGDVILLAGDLGAGKTTLVQAVVAALGSPTPAASPTFALVHEYRIGALAVPVWHCDLYRIDDARELRELGLDELIDDGGGVVLIEWSERLREHGRLPPSYLQVTLHGAGDEPRTLALDGAGRRGQALAAAWRAALA